MRRSDGRDLILGGRGANRLVGGEGGDQFITGPIEETSQNTLSGGGGNDIFLVDNVPASKDIVSCGSGFDRLVADRKDVVAADCERVRVAHGSIEEVFAQEEKFFESLPPAVSEFFNTFFDRLAPDPTVSG